MNEEIIINVLVVFAAAFIGAIGGFITGVLITQKTERKGKHSEATLRNTERSKE